MDGIKYYDQDGKPLDELNSFFVVRKQVPLWRRKWWLKIRIVRDSVRLVDDGERGVMLPIFEFYVPWWAWPFELLHRLVFGQVKLR